MALPNRFGPPQMSNSAFDGQSISNDVGAQNSVPFLPSGPQDPYSRQPDLPMQPTSPQNFSATLPVSNVNSSFAGPPKMSNPPQYRKDEQPPNMNGDLSHPMRTMFNGPALNGSDKFAPPNGMPTPPPVFQPAQVYNQRMPNQGINNTNWPLSAPPNAPNANSQHGFQQRPPAPNIMPSRHPMGGSAHGGPPQRQSLLPQQQVQSSSSPQPGGLFVLGSSEPNSARSSRNPSPISNRQYDSMEGQFPSPRPSPVSSSTNIAGMVQSPSNQVHQSTASRPSGTQLFGQQHSSATNSMAPSNILPSAPLMNHPNIAPPQIGPPNTGIRQMSHQALVAPQLGHMTQNQRSMPPNPVSTAPGPQLQSPPGPQMPAAPLYPPSQPAGISNALPVGGPPPKSGGFPTISPPPNATQQYRPLAVPSYMGHTAPPNEPVTSPPMSGPPIPPVSQQSSRSTPTQSVTQRPRYPQQPQQQANYSQSAPSSHAATGPTSEMYGGQPYNSNNVPDGPVGGVPGGYDPQLHARMAGMSVHNSFSRMWGNDSVNLLQDRHILPPVAVTPPKVILPHEKANCSPEIFRCTITKIPETSSLLQKSRLPLGILIHPFKDMTHLPVIQCNTIVRCRSCRTYINPFVSFVDQRRWKCNLCYRINDLPEEFFFDPSSGTYGDPSRRPEIRNATIEFIAPSEYMLRPPQPAIYLFLLDVSHGAVESGYLSVFCQVLQDELGNLPGDARTRVGIMTFDSSIHFYSIAEGSNRPNMMVVSDTDDVFVPLPDNLLVNLSENKTLLQELLAEIPTKFAHNDDTNSALGAALQAVYKLVSPVGGRVTVMQSVLPNVGPGALKPREDPNQRAATEVNPQVLGPANDFYKKLALDCSGQQVAMDLFLISTQYADIATLACAAKFSSGCLHYYPGFHQTQNKRQVERYENDLRRYLTRKVGFEAVMRIRCTRGLSIHTFHGNFFVRSTDLLSLPNVNPDSGFGMQISIEENLTESNVVCFQAAVLYTSSKGERRIRVHTLSLPVTSNLTDVMGSADQQAIVGLLCKMAVDRSMSSSLSDARDALINASIDILSAFKVTLPASQTAGGLMCPFSVRLVPLYIIALLKHPAFRVAVSTKLDERVFAMEQMKTMPLVYLMTYIYPNLYPVHALDDNNALYENDTVIPQPPLLQLTFEKVDRHGAYLLETSESLILYIGRAVSDYFCNNVFGVSSFQYIDENVTELPELDTPESNRLRNFIAWVVSKRPFHSPLILIREDSKQKHIFLNYMADDRSESSFSYYEFLQHLKQQISK